MLCPICQTKEITGKQTVCSGACRVKKTRMNTEGTIPEKGAPRAEGTPREKGTLDVPVSIMSPQITPAAPAAPRHAEKVAEGTLGSVYRNVSMGPNRPGMWVIPGGHMVGKVDPLWSSCLNPNCPTVI